jgi:peptide/nickel transport system permease protein
MSAADIGVAGAWREPRRSTKVLSLVRHYPMATIGVTIVAVYALTAIFGPLLVGDPLKTVPGDALSSPSSEHLFGTDRFGRDVFTRAVVAARLDVVVGIVIALIATCVGSVIGVVAGYFGGLFDEIVMRLTDIVLAFPGFVLALILVAALGDSIPNVVGAVAVAYTPYFIRLTRSRALAEREREYVDAAGLAGNRSWQIAFRHVLPNSLTPAYTQAALVAGWAVLDVGGLAFLGIGIRPPTAEWGVMVAEGANDVMTGAWWTALFPGALIVLLALAFQLVGDDLQEGKR